MADAKLMVIYPHPKDADVFEKVYQQEHVPLAVAKLSGKTKIVATEVHFPSMQALEACATSEGGKEVLAHAVKISSGGPPIFLVAEEETVTFTQIAVG
jgi:hypothetical protein